MHLQSPNNVLRLSCATADLREEKVDAERRLVVLEETLQLCDLLSEHVWGVADTTNDTNTTGVGDGSGELWASGDVHTGEHDGVVDLQEIGRDRADLLCIRRHV